MTLTKSKAKVVYDALMTIVSEEATPYLSSMTPAMLSGEQYNRVGELYRILDPDTGDQSLQLPSESQESCEPSPNSQTGTPANRRLSPGTGGQSLEPRPDSRNRRELGQESKRSSTQSNVERSVGTLTAPLTTPSIDMQLAANQEVIVRVGQLSLRLRNMDGNLALRNEDTWRLLEDLSPTIHLNVAHEAGGL